MSGKTDSQGAPFAFSVCEIVDNWLCINHRPGHVGTPNHVLHVILFLSDRGVLGVRSLISRYGIMAVDLAAVEVDLWEAAGVDWQEGIRRPGALIHKMIERGAKE